MFDTSTYVLTCFFSFDVEPLEQIFGQIDKYAFINKLEFDFSVCGFFDGYEYFSINQVIFNDIASMNKGEAIVELESTRDPGSILPNGLPVVCHIANFIKENNSTIFLIDSSMKSGSIEVAFKAIYIN